MQSFEKLSPSLMGWLITILGFIISLYTFYKSNKTAKAASTHGHLLGLLKTFQDNIVKFRDELTSKDDPLNRHAIFNAYQSLGEPSFFPRSATREPLNILKKNVKSASKWLKKHKVTFKSNMGDIHGHRNIKDIETCYKNLITTIDKISNCLVDFKKSSLYKQEDHLEGRLEVQTKDLESNIQKLLDAIDKAKPLE